ncbi:MAG: phosphodiester glycosidase family protein [Pseudomonadota bacterium]|nr:phosphodiester glycosidase family protein [Pseudomonadota bacterium]
MKARILLCLLSSLILFTSAIAAPASEERWKQIDDGLHYGVFEAPAPHGVGKARLVVVRIDPGLYEFHLLAASELRPPTGSLTVKEWADKYRLLAAVNAGMFQEDMKTNVGYMKNYAHLNNPRIHRKYASAFAFNHKTAEAPPTIWDTDTKQLKQISGEYHTVIQNLRLIKRPGLNRWPPQEKRWSEAALGQDEAGNLLFIFSKSPMSMHDLGNILLKLPLGIVCAQHLEGGALASLYLRHRGVEIREAGASELVMAVNRANDGFLPIPNAIGIRKKKSANP